MKNKGQLFELKENLQIYNKTVSIRKKKISRETSFSSSVNFFDDQQPITLSGPGRIEYNMSLDWAVESFESAPVQDVEYIVESSIDPQPVDMINTQAEEANPVYEEVITTKEETVKQTPAMTAPIKALSEVARGLSDDTLATDLAEILEGKKVFDPETKKMVQKEEVKDDFLDKLKTADKQRDHAETNESKEKPIDQQAIFDKIAQSMNYANAFDLGEFELEKRFDSFDQEEGQNLKTGSPAPLIPIPPQPKIPDPISSLPKPPDIPNIIPESLPFSTEEFVKDLDLIKLGSEAFTEVNTGVEWPPRPADLVLPTVERTKQMFGTFEYEPIPGHANCEVKLKGNWEANNISMVDIPQLKGKINGTTNAEIKKGTIRFNNKAVKQLQKLWKAWEEAGLLDRIVTYDGGFVPRFKKISGGGCATSLSNHAWGSAFDINASWNGLGKEPALIGAKGCTRELVQIANAHGFYWGGHYGTKDGMHFEVAKIIEYND
jgi:hypothetical protein